MKRKMTETVMKAVNSCRSALEFASERLKHNREIVMTAVPDNFQAFNHATKIFISKNVFTM